MRKYLASGSKWVWLFALVLVSLMALGLAILPEVFKGGYKSSGTPAGLYVMTLLTLALFVGVIISLALERFERMMVILFVAFRIGEMAWEFELGRHSLWYLIGNIILHLVVGGAVILFLSGRKASGETNQP